MKGILKQQKLLMLLEFWPCFGKQGNESFQLLKDLREFGFTIHVIHPAMKDITLLKEDETERLVETLRKKDTFTNLLVAKGEPSFSG